MIFSSSESAILNSGLEQPKRPGHASVRLRSETVFIAAVCCRLTNQKATDMCPELWNVVRQFMPSPHLWLRIGCRGLLEEKPCRRLLSRTLEEHMYQVGGITESGLSENGQLTAWRHAINWALNPGDGLFRARFLVEGPPIMTVGFYNSAKTEFTQRVEASLRGVSEDGILVRKGDLQRRLPLPPPSSGMAGVVSVLDRVHKVQVLFTIDCDDQLRYTVDGSPRPPVRSVRFDECRAALLISLGHPDEPVRGVYVPYEKVDQFLADLSQLLSLSDLSGDTLLRSTVPQYVPWQEHGTVLTLSVDYQESGFKMQVGTEQPGRGHVVIFETDRCNYCMRHDCNRMACAAKAESPLGTFIPFIALPVPGTAVTVLDICQTADTASERCHLIGELRRGSPPVTPTSTPTSREDAVSRCSESEESHSDDINIARRT